MHLTGTNIRSRSQRLFFSELKRLQPQGRGYRPGDCKGTWEDNLPLVILIAKPFRGRGVDLMDLIQAGSLGLYEAFWRFDPQRGYAFSSYAHWWIRDAIYKVLLESKTVRLSKREFEFVRQQKKIRDELEEKLGREATEGELVDALARKGEDDGGQAKPVRLGTYLTMVSLDRPKKTEDEADGGIIDLLADEAPLADEIVGAEGAGALVSQLLSSLPLAQARVLTGKFGLGEPDEEGNLAEVGRKIGVGRERASQLEKAAIASLRRALQIKPGQTYTDWLESATAQKRACQGLSELGPPQRQLWLQDEAIKKLLISALTLEERRLFELTYERWMSDKLVAQELLGNERKGAVASSLRKKFEKMLNKMFLLVQEHGLAAIVSGQHLRQLYEESTPKAKRFSLAI